MQTLVINKNDADQRIDSFLKKTYPKLSLSLLYRYLRVKRIKVNNKRVEPNYRLCLNDNIELFVNDEYLSKRNSKTDFLLAPVDIDIIYQDDNILVVNKPAGLVVHEDETKTNDTLINRVLHFMYERKQWDHEKENSFVPSLVHRIDRNTSGLVLIAKNAESLRVLHEKIKTHEIDKYYECLVHGIVKPKSGTLIDYLTRNLQTKIVTITKKPFSRLSEKIITKYRTIKNIGDTTLLEIHLITGKTHQIRAHMAFINHPLVGEKKYTTPQFSKLDKKQYQALVAKKISFHFKTDAKRLNYLKNKTICI